MDRVLIKDLIDDINQYDAVCTSKHVLLLNVRACQKNGSLTNVLVDRKVFTKLIKRLESDLIKTIFVVATDNGIELRSMESGNQSIHFLRGYS